MNSDARFYDSYTRQIVSPWWLYLLLGLNLILLAILIMIFPELLAYLVAAFLLIDGLLFLVIGWQVRRLARLYKGWRDELLSSAGR